MATVAVLERKNSDSYTPGPWTIDLVPDLGVMVLSETTEEPVAALGGSDEVGIGDARLIVAAPELLAVAREARDLLRRSMNFHDAPSIEEMNSLNVLESDLLARLNQVLAAADPTAEQSSTA